MSKIEVKEIKEEYVIQEIDVRNIVTILELIQNACAKFEAHLASDLWSNVRDHDPVTDMQVKSLHDDLSTAKELTKQVKDRINRKGG